MVKNIDPFHVISLLLLLQTCNCCFNVYVLYTTKSLPNCLTVCASTQVAAAFDFLLVGVMSFFVGINCFMQKSGAEIENDEG